MERKRVIIDCDPGIDDSLALMLALNSPELEVVGITIVCGNVPVELGFENAKKILKLMNRLDIPIYKGEEKPLKREYVSAQDTHGMDGLGESAIALVEGYERQRDAVTYLSRNKQYKTVDNSYILFYTVYNKKHFEVDENYLSERHGCKHEVNY